MLDLTAVYSVLRECGIEFIAGVPDTLLNDFCLSLSSEWETDRHVIAANEGNAIALAAGYQLATGTVPLVYMQNSGLGNAINPLVSLVDPAVYAIPMVLLIGWRGEPGSNDWPQHQRQGEISPVLLDVLKIPYRTLDVSLSEALETIRWSVNTARKISQPTALLVRKNVLAKKEKAGFDQTSQSYAMSREEAIRTILSAAPADTIYIASTGRITRELHALRNELGQSHDLDFLNVGAMGHALSIAAGIAAAKSDRTVICLDGDGAAIMHLGSLAVTANQSVPNLLHIVLNNGVHESVGGQATVGNCANLTNVGSAFGYSTLLKSAQSADELAEMVKELLTKDGPKFIEARIRKGMRTDMPALKFNLILSKEKLLKAMA